VCAFHQLNVLCVVLCDAELFVHGVDSCLCAFLFVCAYFRMCISNLMSTYVCVIDCACVLFWRAGWPFSGRKSGCVYVYMSWCLDLAAKQLDQPGMDCTSLFLFFWRCCICRPDCLGGQRNVCSLSFSHYEDDPLTRETSRILFGHSRPLSGVGSCEFFALR